jgi:hypothetical protein
MTVGLLATPARSLVRHAGHVARTCVGVFAGFAARLCAAPRAGRGRWAGVPGAWRPAHLAFALVGGGFELRLAAAGFVAHAALRAWEACRMSAGPAP